MTAVTGTDPLPDALFERVADGTYRATELARGPWDPAALHGGPPCALVAGVLERAMADADLGVEFFPARFTAELTRPIPLGELKVETTIRRPGRRICLADAELTDSSGSVLLRATLQGIRRLPFTDPRGPSVDAPTPPEQSAVSPPAMADVGITFHVQGTEHRYASGSGDEAGPAADWIRLTAPLVADRDTSPLERLVAAADFGNGISRWYDGAEILFVNPDLTVTLHRLPAGEWVCVDAETWVGSDGVGIATSQLFDRDGPVGRASQTLLVERR